MSETAHSLHEHGVDLDRSDFVSVVVTEDGGVRIRTAFGALSTGQIPIEGRRHLAALLIESATNEEIAERSSDVGEIA